MSNLEKLKVNPSLPLSKKFSETSAYGAPVIDCNIKLNTNENPYKLPEVVKNQVLTELDKNLSEINRYPDRLHEKLRYSIVRYLFEVTQTKLDINQVWAANGSNEILQQILQAFSDPGATALGFEPSYSMHKILSEVNGFRYQVISRESDFSIDIDQAKKYIIENKPRIVFITTPNNPTGTITAIDQIAQLLTAANQTIFIVDEAYAEFSDKTSAITLVEKFPNLFVTRTMSKAFAFAGARIGYVVAQPETLSALVLTRLPYHLSAQSQIMAQIAFENYRLLQKQVQQLTSTRNWMQQEMVNMGFEVIPSEANFFLFGKFQDQKIVWQTLVDRSILVRDVGISGFLRVTVGTEEESQTFVHTLKDLLNNKLIKFY